MIWTVLGFVARVLGPILPFLAVWVARGRHASLRGKNEALRSDNRALTERERIEDDVASDPDLAVRARRSVLRKPRQ